ncbi:MAG: hypothetical protein Q4C52_08865 [Eubacteriales bacterium]|nr:hypothetical protein [Eubacteriales bacterium]
MNSNEINKNNIFIGEMSAIMFTSAMSSAKIKYGKRLLAGMFSEVDFYRANARE